MAFIKRDYWKFYVMGRWEKKLIKTDLTETDIVDSVLRPDGVSLRDAIADACRKAAAPLEAGKTRRQWLEAHKAEIAAAGGDEAEAYKAWLQGRVDELAYSLEGDIIPILAEASGAADDPDGEDDEDEDDGEDDEGEDEDEDDDDEDEEDDDQIPPRRSLGTRR